MICATCTLPIADDEPRIAVGATLYHAPYVYQARDEIGEPVGDPVPMRQTCPPAVEPGPPAPPPAPEPRYILSVLEFTTGRLTQAERERIELAMDLHPDPRTRVRLRLLDKDVQNAGNKQVDMRDPRMQMGVGYLTTVVFEGALLIEPARLPQILAPAVAS